MTIPTDRITAAQRAAAEARVRAMIRRATDDADGSPEDSWRRLAECRKADPEIFHDPRPDTEDTRRALAHCAACPVAAQCGAYGDKLGASGVWGGTWRPDPYASPRELRARKVAA